MVGLAPNTTPLELMYTFGYRWIIEHRDEARWTHFPADHFHGNNCLRSSQVMVVLAFWAFVSEVHVP